MTLAQSSLGSQGGIRLRRATATVVGRSIELGALEEAVEAARDGIAGISLEGEPGIGKSRLLLAAADVARNHGFTPVTVSADEELRGPFLLARTLFSSQALRDGASERVVAALDRACDVVAGRDEGGLGGLAPEERLLRVIDQASLALRAAALERPLALLLDDLQWADQDSLRLLRYLVRTQPSLQVFFAIALRPEESVQTPELLTLLADMDRMGIVRRLRVNRFRQAETGDLLRQALGDAVAPPTIAAIHGQAEGVPFVIEELVRAYRDAGLLQVVDGSWTLAPKAGRLVPSSVRTLVQRRAASLQEATKSVLADAAVLGRSFRASDVCAIRSQLGQPECTAAAVGELLEPAVAAGLLGTGTERSGADYTFSHEQVHDFAAGLLPPARRRAIHAAIVDLLAADDRATPATQAILAHHALAAGDTDRAARYSVEAAQAALRANAPDEALRLVDEALAVVAAIGPRVELLRIRDDAFEMLRRVDDRLEGLTELAALAEAGNDRGLAAEVMLRRAGALRFDGQREAAATLARDVRAMAAEQGDREREIAACIELGQALMGATLGEGYAPTPFEADFDGAEEAYLRAAELAEAMGRRRTLAAVTRELGVIATSRARAWFVGAYRRGDHIDILRHVAAGGRLEEIAPTLPIHPLLVQAIGLFQRALELFEEEGDRRGAMSAIIAMAYAAWAPDVHVGASPAHRIEEIRRLAGRLRSLSQESERAAAEAQMVYGVHVFCRAKVIPDLALARGREVMDRARVLGDRGLEFLAAVGTARAALEVGDLDEAKRAIDRAAAVAAASPTPARARELEVIRGLLAGAHGNIEHLRRHMTQALEATLRQDRRAARCEILATYALECARLAEAGTTELIPEAEAQASEALRLAAELPGHAPWAAQADAALATAAFERGDPGRALDLARRALAGRREADREEPHLEILLPAARVILAAGPPDEAAAVRDELQLIQALIVQRTLDSDARAAWFRGPVGGRLSALAGPYETPARAGGESAPQPEVATGGAAPTAEERRLLGLLIEGRTNAEIAAEVGMPAEAVARALAAMYARIGASSRAQATVMALTGAV